METSSKIRLYSKGEIYRNGMSLTDTIDILKSFNAAYLYCIDKSTRTYSKDKVYFYQPQINIEYIRRGSLSSLFTVDFPASYAMISPLISGRAWDLFKTSLEYAQTIIGFSKKERRAPVVNIENSPNSTNIILTVAGNGNISVGKDVYDTYRNNKGAISSMAEYIGAAPDSFLDIKKMALTGKTVEDKVRFDQQNKALFIIEEREIVTSDPMPYPCKIYSFNVRSKRGRLDIIGRVNDQDSENAGSVLFEVADGPIEAYIDAMKQEVVTVVATAKMIVNTIGESRITHLYPVRIAG